MIDIMEKIIDWMDKYLQVVIIPLVILLLLRVIFQIITH